MRRDVQKMFLDKNQTIRDAMEQLDITAAKNLYVVDFKKKLLGSVSDGDIRRGILKGIDLDKKVAFIMNSTPKYVEQFKCNTKYKMRDIFVDTGIETMPIVDNQMRVVDIVFAREVLNDSHGVEYTQKKNPVFILAGGVGARLEPFTKILPKPLMPIGDKPILEKILEKFDYYGFNNFILSLNYKAEMIKMYFSDKEIKLKYPNISYINETKMLGTIGSLCLAEPFVQESFFITNSDILIETNAEKIFNFHKEQNAILTIVGCIKNAQIPYGVLDIGEQGNLISIKEKPSYNHVVNTGVYVAEPKLISYLQLNEKKDMTELIEDILKDGEKISVYPILEEQWFDVGQWEEFERTRKYFEKY